MRTQGERLLETGKQTAQGFQFMNKYGCPYNPHVGLTLKGFYSDIYLYSLDRRDLETLRQGLTGSSGTPSEPVSGGCEPEDGRYEGGNEGLGLDRFSGRQ